MSNIDCSNIGGWFDSPEIEWHEALTLDTVIGKEHIHLSYLDTT